MRHVDLTHSREKVLSNLQARPDDPRARVLNPQGASFRRRVACVEGHMEALLLLGFEFKSSGPTAPVVLQLPPSLPGRRVDLQALVDFTQWAASASTAATTRTEPETKQAWDSAWDTDLQNLAHLGFARDWCVHALKRFDGSVQLFECCVCCVRLTLGPDRSRERLSGC